MPAHERTASLTMLVACAAGAAVLLAACTSTSTGTSPSSSAPASSEAPATATAMAVEFGAVGTTETVPCPSELAAGAAFAEAGTEVEGETYSCGVVVVPENHDQPDGRTIELFYLKLHSASASPAGDPLVYLAGGPGSTGSYELTANPGLYKSMQPIRQDRDIIAYDQRGTGFSNYLLCAPFESTLGILQDRDTNPEISQTIEEAAGRGLGHRLRRPARQSVRGGHKAARRRGPRPVQQREQREGHRGAHGGPRLHRWLQPLRHELRHEPGPVRDARRSGGRAQRDPRRGGRSADPQDVEHDQERRALRRDLQAVRGGCRLREGLPEPRQALRHASHQAGEGAARLRSAVEGLGAADGGLPRGAEPDRPGLLQQAREDQQHRHRRRVRLVRSRA